MKYFRRFLTFTILAVMGAVSVNASDLDTSFRPIIVNPENPSVFGLVGAIDARTAFNFKRATSKYGMPSELRLDSLGGEVHEGLLLALEIQQLGIKTRVTGNCMSACFFVFMAGAERTIEGRLGVHQMSNASNDFSSGQIAIADMMDVLAGLNVPSDVIVLMLQTPADEMHVFSPAEIARFGLETIGFSTTQKPKGREILGSAISFVSHHNEIWSQENRTALAQLPATYASSVQFYGNAWSRKQVLDEKRTFATRWPVRNYTFMPSRSASFCSQDGRCTVIGEVEWYAHSPSRGKTSVGTASVEIGLFMMGSSFLIFKENGKVISRR